jgi:3-methyladenine DNA glycosylase AlkD
MDSALLRRIQEELVSKVDPAPKRSPQSFFKEEIKAHGVKSALVERISAVLFKEIRGRGKVEILSLCEALFRTDYMEESIIACNWAYALRDRYEPRDFEVFQDWLNKYINNWAKCDTLCNHTIGAFVEQFPEYVNRLKEWTKSDSRWVRRASAVTLILPARNGMFLEEILEIADSLLLDRDDLVRKGYGWMLKEAGRLHQREVFDYVMRRKTVMPRTALRYAIEKMPDNLRQRAMER